MGRLFTGPDEDHACRSREDDRTRQAHWREFQPQDLGRRPVEDRRRLDLGMDFLRSQAEPHLLRDRQSLHLEPSAAAGRQQMVDDHFRPRPRHGHGQVGLPDDAARPVGLRRHQRDDPRRPQHRRQGAQDARRISTATASAIRSTARTASCWSRRNTIPRSTGPRRSTWTRARRTTAVRRSSTQYAPGSKGEDVNYTNICPAALGSKDEQPASYSPETGLFYVPTNHVCMDYEPFRVAYTAGQPYVGATLSMYPAPGGKPWATSLPGTQRGQDRVVRTRAVLGLVGRAFDRGRRGLLRHARRLFEGGGRQDGQGTLQVQDPVRHHRQRHDLRA